MRAFNLDPLTAVVVVSLLLVGGLGLFVGLPLMSISWVWNACVAENLGMPTIGLWQAGLLYAALACIIYLSGIVHLEIKTETSE